MFKHLLFAAIAVLFIAQAFKIALLYFIAFCAIIIGIIARLTYLAIKG